MRPYESYSSFNGARESNGPTFYPVDLDQRRPYNAGRYSGDQTQMIINERNDVDRLNLQAHIQNRPRQDGPMDTYNHHAYYEPANNTSSQLWSHRILDYSASQLPNQQFEPSAHHSSHVLSNPFHGSMEHQPPTQLNCKLQNGSYQPMQPNQDMKSVYDEPFKQPDKGSTSDGVSFNATYRTDGLSAQGSYPPKDEEANNRNSLDSCSIYIGNVDYGAHPLDLQRQFRSCGVIERITIMANRDTGQPKGYAYLEFDLHLAAREAVKMFDGSEFLGREIKVCLKRTNVPGHSHAGHGYYRGRGRGRGGGKRGRGRGLKTSFTPY